MSFHLIDSRLYFTERSQIDITVGVKVRNSDRPRLADPTSLFHRPISAVIVVERLVNKQQVHIRGL